MFDMKARILKPIVRDFVSSRPALGNDALLPRRRTAPGSLAVRSPLFNQIMYGKDGLMSAERELGAVGASVVNRCVYCAAVHASRFNGLTKRPEVMHAIFRDERDAKLEPRERAIFDFAAQLSETPPALDETAVENLSTAGLDMLEAVDLVFSAVIFGWANRLMHTLGEPTEP